jgi:hypothetical protein
MLHPAIGMLLLLNSLEVDNLQQHVFVVASHFMFSISLGLVEEDENKVLQLRFSKQGNSWLLL